VFGLNAGVAAALLPGCHTPEPIYPTYRETGVALEPITGPLVEPTLQAKTGARPGGEVVRLTKPALPFAVNSGRGTESVRQVSATEPAAAAGKHNSGVVPPDPVPAPPSVPAAAAENFVDLGTSLRLAGVGNPTINLAREVVREASARYLAARVLLLPDINVGGNYHLHQGVLQASPGIIRQTDSQALFLGFGARTLAAETVAFPGIRLFSHLGDAIFEPLAARQRVAVRSSESQAVQNATLLDVAVRYLELVGAEGQIEVLRQSELELARVYELTARYARAGQGRAGDANRASANTQMFRRQTQQAEENAAVASARLAELLSLDPSTRLHPPPGKIRPVRLVDEEADLQALVAQALRSRPEITARTAAVAEAQTRVRQERTRPWFPTLSVGFSGGGFGAGSNKVDPYFSSILGRTDLDVMAYWTFQNMGLGNRARTRTAAALRGQAIAALDTDINRVRDEVGEAKARAEQAARQVEIAHRALAIAEEGAQLELTRIKQAVGLPLTVLDSFRQLAEARQELVRALVEFNVSQFRLFVALGLSPLAQAAPAEVGPPTEVHATPPAAPGLLPPPANAEPALPPPNLPAVPGVLPMPKR
jgi:outer membrane protein TolC